MFASQCSISGTAIIITGQTIKWSFRQLLNRSAFTTDCCSYFVWEWADHRHEGYCRQLQCLTFCVNSYQNLHFPFYIFFYWNPLLLQWYPSVVITASLGPSIPSLLHLMYFSLMPMACVQYLVFKNKFICIGRQQSSKLKTKQNKKLIAIRPI